MDIKKRIQELSLDQKAKLYFMGLVRQGKIDRLPEDPKAAYVSMMMDKDDYGRSISGKDKRTFMEPEDSMPAARARKLAGMEDDEMETRYDYDDPVFESLKEIASELGYLNENEPTVFDDQSMDELLDIILKYVEDPDDAQAELDRFDQGGFDALSDYVAANLDRDPEYKAWYNKLHSIDENRLSSYEMGKLPDFELLRKNVSQMLGVEVDDDVRSGRYNGREGYYSRISRRDLTDWNEEQIEKLKQAFEKTNLESENYEFEYNGVSDFEVEPGERDYPASFDYFATEKK